MRALRSRSDIVCNPVPRKNPEPASPVSEDAAASPGEPPINLPPSKLKRRAKRTGWRALVEWVVVIGGAFGLALLIQAFLFQPFRIPSGSMIPTLDVHDRIVVNKLSYKLHDVHRGDVVVFTTPQCQRPSSPTWANCGIVGEYRDLVKRVIALPGDRLAISGGRVYINGEQLDEPYVRKGSTTVGQPPFGCGFPGTRAHPYVIPKGMMFVMGDNRNNSYDSRCFGPVKESKIVGRAFLRIWPISRIGWL